MKFLIQYVKKYQRILWGALLLAAINQVFSLLDPQIFRLIIDRYASHVSTLPHGVFLRGVLLLLLASMGVALVSRIAKNFQDYYVNVITQRVGAGLYERSIEHAFSLPYAVLEDQRSGEVLQKLQKARTDAQALITSSINTIFFALVGIIFVLVYAFMVHWFIGLTLSLIIPALGVFTFVISKRIKTSQKQIVAESADLAGSTTETLRNVELVKSLGLEDQETKRLNNVNDSILRLELKKIRLIRYLSFSQGTLINTMRALLLLLMLWLVFQKLITLGQFFSIYIYSFFIFTPLSDFGTVASQYQEAKASMEALQKILEIQPELKPPSPVSIGQLRFLTFQDVGFVYPDAADHSLYDINLTIQNGETVAFVGPTGAGKTTIVKLLLWLHRPTSGKLLFNGVDAQEVDYGELRKRIGYVSQETQLFAGTVRENLLFVNPNADDKQCLYALEQAAAVGIIERGSRGLDTRIGEGGIKISGGERQRLAIARSLLRDPEFIVFDEATSSLDSITEKAINETIQSIVRSRPNLITVLIAHRLPTISHADRIYVLEKGEIVEEGRHADLLQKQGLYAALWREQSGN